MTKYKAIIYDIDGTILNTLNMNMYPLIQIIKEELNEEWSFEEVTKFAAYPGKKVMEELNIKNPDEVYQRWVNYVNAYKDGAMLYQGFDEVFQTFAKNNVQQAIVSAKTTEQYEIDFVSKGLDKFMSATVLADDTNKHKPDPTPLLVCLDKLKMNPNDVIYIGDALSDMIASKNAGIDFGYARWGSVSDEGVSDPTYIFEQPIDLLKLLHV